MATVLQAPLAKLSVLLGVLLALIFSREAVSRPGRLDRDFCAGDGRGDTRGVDPAGDGLLGGGDIVGRVVEENDPRVSPGELWS